MKIDSPRIFISYSRGGAAHTWAEAVQARLLLQGARPWRDETGVLEGDSDLYDRIESELHAADLLWRPSSAWIPKCAAGRGASSLPPTGEAGRS